MILFKQLFIDISSFTINFKFAKTFSIIVIDFQQLLFVTKNRKFLKKSFLIDSFFIVDFNFLIKTSSTISIIIFNNIDFVFVFIVFVRKFFAKLFITSLITFVIDFKKN